MKKFILLGVLLAPGAGYATPATLTVLTPVTVSTAQVFNSSVTVDVGTASVLGGADYTLTFDTHVVSLNALAPIAAELRNNFFFNPGALAQGRVRIVALNGASSLSPSGLVSLSSMTLTAVGAGGSSTTVNAEVNLLIDTQTVVYSPVSVVSGSVTIQGADHLPPRTQLVVSTPTFGQNPIFVSSRTFFSFNAVDDKSTVGDGQGVGVKDTQVAVDSAPFTVITGTFNITAEGLHMIRWFSEDLVGNVEVVHSSSVFVDNTPPATQIAFSAPPFVSVSSQVYISSGTRISFSAQDAGSGVAFTQFQVDGGTFQRFSSSFTLAEGIHVIAFRSQDNVANLEPPQNSTVQVDGTPPVSVLQVGTPQVGLANGTLAISSQTALVIVSTDPVSNGVASGVQSILVSVDSAPFAIVSGSFTITAEGLHLLRWFARDNVGNTEVVKSTSVFVDTTPPVTRIAFSTPPFVSGSGQVFISSTTNIGFTATDADSGVAFTRFSIDGAAFRNFVSSFTLGEGLHVIAFQSQDDVGNLEAVKVSSVAVDATAPVTTLAISSGPFISTSTAFSLQAQDPISKGVASGIQQTFFRLDTSSFTPYTSSFVIPSSGTHTLQWFSQDQVVNKEVVRSTSVLVEAPPVAVDTSAPVAILLSPSPEAKEMDQIFGQGTVPVIGTAGGAGFAFYRVEFAKGAGSSVGFSPVAESSVPVSSATLASWDTRSLLPGFFTLRLISESVTGKIAVSTATVFIGTPPLLLSLRNPPSVERRHESVKIIDGAQGIAVDAQGQIYLANTEANEVVKLDGQGRLLARFDGATRSSFEDRDAFRKPVGVAVDRSGNIYVADRGNDRVVILDASGQVVRAIGRRDRHDEDEEDDDRGKRPEQFHTPSGVAVSETRLAVADKGNGRLAVFDLAGSFLFEARLPRSLGLGEMRPFGVAIDAQGNLYAADQGHDRVIVFDSSGRFLFAAGRRGKSLGQFDDPRGLSVSSLGMLYVADNENERIQKLDAFRNFVLRFDGGGFLPDPVGTAMDSAGRLFVSDIQRDQILEFGLTSGGFSGLQFVSDPNGLARREEDEHGRGGDDGHEHGRGDRSLAAAGTPDPSLAFRAVFVFPNPAKGGAAPTIHAEVGIADQVTFKIFSVAGQELQETTITASPSLIDSGAGPQYAYEYAWTGHVASGVYLFVVDAQKGGSHLTKSGKFAVVR